MASAAMAPTWSNSKARVQNDRIISEDIMLAIPYKKEGEKGRVVSKCPEIGEKT